MKFKAAIAALSITTGMAGVAVASNPAPVTVNVQSVGFYNPGYLHVNGAGFNDANVLAGPIQLNSTIGASTTVYSLQAFCIDLYHQISVSVGGQINTALTYVTAPLATDSSGATTGTGAPLSGAQSREIGALTLLADQLYASHDADLNNKLLAIQGAIWSLEYPDATVTGTNPDMQSWLTTYVGEAPHLPAPSTVFALYDTRDNTQGFTNANLVTGDFRPTAGVPEPAAWTMMLLGVAGLGALLRRRRLLTEARAAA